MEIADVLMLALSGHLQDRHGNTTGKGTEYNEKARRERRTFSKPHAPNAPG